MSKDNQSLLYRIYPSLFMLIGFLGVFFAGLMESHYIFSDLQESTDEMFSWIIGIPCFIIMVTGAIVSKRRKYRRTRY